MDFIRELGHLVLDHRCRRLMETLLRTAEEVYQARGLRFRARWTSTYLLLEQDGPLAVTEIAHRLGLTHPAVIGITDEMRQAGLVSNVRDLEDARRRPMVLTPAARRLKPVLRVIWQELAQVQRDRFAEAGCDVTAVLDRVEDGMAQRSLTAEILERLGRSTSGGRRAVRLGKVLISGALVFLLSGCSEQPAPMPATLAGKTMSEFLTAYNSADFQPVAAFFERHGSGERSLERARWVMGFLYPGVRRFQVEGIVDSTPLSITVRGSSELTEAWYRFSIEVDSVPPHGVSFGFENDEAPPGWSGRRETAATYLRRLAAADFFSGTVMVADDSRVIHSGAYGDVPTLATQINLGSANKMFTAVAIMQLMEQGRLQLNDGLGRYLPDYPNPDAREQVTIHHLLTHTSGIGDFFNEKYMARKKAIRSVAELLPLFATEPLQFRPGEKWQYSNGGYAVLGRVIEQVSGMTYEAYVQTHVFGPAGMGRTSGDPREPYARGHTFLRQGGGVELTRVVNDFALPGTGSPAGGGYSTVEDLVAFARALRAGKLVSPTSLERMLTPHVTTDRGTQYGYGFEITTRNGETVFGHNGHHLGISAQLDVFHESGMIVAVLSNYDPPTAPVVAARLGRLAAY